ncbi:MAG: hypothetical protein QGI60_02990 [archaeon]|jgi:hypothetical protein|nr:hypothetical protein [archaeon]
MADEIKEAESAVGHALGRVDSLFDKFSSYLSDRISTFVAFLFVLISLGGFYGYFIVPRFPELSIYLLIAPLGIALIAYYNRTFATIMFLGILALTFIL